MEPSDPIVVAIGGVRGSGKDTLGDLLCYDWGFQRTAFADPIKRMLQIAFPGITYTQLFGASKHREESIGIKLRGLDPRNGQPMLPIQRSVERFWSAVLHGTVYGRDITTRLAAQSLGTEWGRRLYEDIWVDACWAHIQSTDPTNSLRRFCITDCRFENEVRRVKELGGVVVKLRRGIDEAMAKTVNRDNADTHQSETEFLSIPDSEFDFIIDNRVPLDELSSVLDPVVPDIITLAEERTLALKQGE